MRALRAHGDIAAGAVRALMGRQNTALAWALAVAVAVIAALSIALVGTTNRLAELESGAEQGQVANAPAPEPPRRALQGELTQATPANPEAIDCYNDMGADGELQRSALSYTAAVRDLMASIMAA
eukprot:COSAG04_NODE_10_length_43369_cov_4.059025_17_plen_125_part_00